MSILQLQVKHQSNRVEKWSKSPYYDYYNTAATMLGFCRAMLCKRGLCRHAVSVYMSVCVYVCHLRVRAKRHSNTPTGTPPPNGSVECKWGRQKSRL